MNQNKRAAPIKTIMMLIIIIAFFLYLYVDRTNINNSNPPSESAALNQIEAKITYDFNSRAQFYSYGNNFFYFCTKDGISYCGLDGQPKWNEVFDMSTPLLVGNGNFVAVAEIKNKNIYVYGPTGLLYSKFFEHPIYNFSINSIGYTCVMLQTATEYETHIFDNTGNTLQTRKDPFGNTLPITYSLSNDGKLLAFSTLDISSVQMVSVLSFADVQNSNPQDKIDGYLGGLKKPNQLIAGLSFLENDTLISISDLEICGYTRNEGDTITPNWTLSLTNEIKQIQYTGNKGFALVHGRIFKNEQGNPENTIEFYNLFGVRTGIYTMPKTVTYLSANSSGAIVGCGASFYAFNLRGQLLWEWNAGMDLEQVVFLSGTDTIIASGNMEASIMKRERR